MEGRQVKDEGGGDPQWSVVSCAVSVGGSGCQWTVDVCGVKRCGVWMHSASRLPWRSDGHNKRIHILRDFVAC